MYTVFMKPLYKIFLIILVLFFLSAVLYAETIKGIKAYPVPFDPGRNSLTIATTTNKYANVNLSIVVEIFDFNGDRVYKRTFSSFPIKWKGYSSSGESVENGLYFVKITVENLDSGVIDKGIMRILVKK